MLNTMTVRCDQCGQENNPQYRFCGICGAPLRSTPPLRVEAPAERVPTSVSGPSFLGLGDEPSRNLDYLLEDEPRSGRAVTYVILVLVVAGIAFSGWYWGDDLYALASRWADRLSASSTPSPPSPVSTPAPPPEATENQNGPHSATVADQDQSTKPASPEPAATAQTVPPPQEKAADTSSEPPSKGSEAAASSNQSPAQEAGKEEAKPEETKPEETRPAVTETAASAPKMAKTPKPKPQPATPSASPEDRLVADGEKYLYGSGVPQDCNRAQRNLLAGARASNGKAFTLLGAMYATGHCVTRDLPTAYRWFARALHQEPTNTRLEQNLEVIWRQMTPEERQVAQRNP